MNNIIIITGHGKYASGMKSSLEMIAGENEKVYAVDFIGNDSNVTVRDKFLKIINDHPHSSIIFCCDLLGGTPFKEASLLAFNSSNMEVVGGCNIGSLLDTIMKMDTMPIDLLASNLIENSKKNIILLDKQSKFKEANSNDGI